MGFAKKQKTPPFLTVAPNSPESIARMKMGEVYLENMARNDAAEKIRAEQYYRENPDARTNSNGQGLPAIPWRDYKVEDGSLQTSCAASTEPEKIVWGLPGWLPLRKFTILAGPRKSGKSLIACSIAARFSRGDGHPAWPGKPSPGWGRVLILSTEDDFADTIVPRLVAAGANLDNIYNIDGISRFCPTRPFSFADNDDVESLCAFAEKIGGVSLIILEPASLAIKGDASSNVKAQAGYVKIAELAKRLNAAVLGVAHVMKTAKGKGGVDRISGPLAVCGVARCVMVTTKIVGAL